MKLQNQLLFYFILIIFTNLKMFSIDKNRTCDSLYWHRILSNLTEHNVYLCIDLKTIDFDGDILIWNNQFWSMCFNKIKPYKKEEIVSYRISIIKSLLDGNPFVFKNDSLSALNMYNIIKISDSIKNTFKHYEIIEIYNKYFDKVDENYYILKIQFYKDLQLYYSIIYYLIENRKIVFIHGFSGNLCVYNM
jgi:hypothetical protein